MARTHLKPRYFASRGGYYVCVGKKQVLLAKGEKEDPEVQEAAKYAFDALMASKLDPGSYSTTFYALSNAYLVWIKEEKSNHTFVSRRRFLKKLSDKHGNLPARDISLFLLEQFIREQPKWGNASKRQLIIGVIACYNWAVKRKIIKENPFSGMGKPQSKSRAKNIEDLLTPEIYKAMLDISCQAGKDAMVGLYETGARPSELFAVEARNYNRVERTLTPDVGKNKRHEGRPPRTLYVTSTLAQILDRLCETHKSGPIFRSPRGASWNSDHFGEWFLYNKGRAGISSNVTPYFFRHSFATRWLKSGGSIAKLAIIMDTSVKIIEFHYSHLAMENKSFVDEIEKLTGS